MYISNKNKHENLLRQNLMLNSNGIVYKYANDIKNCERNGVLGILRLRWNGAPLIQKTFMKMNENY